MESSALSLDSGQLVSVNRPVDRAGYHGIDAFPRDGTTSLGRRIGAAGSDGSRVLGGAVLKETVPVCSFPHAEACSFVAFGGIPVIVSYPMKAEG
jgi:hypothetical protein